ncbi:hypothetical protein AW729_06630 [Methanosphaera sp. BMS]|nr:hypothetical protein AW729_06630 [Methanosphaera sp. BMS]
MSASATNDTTDDNDANVSTSIPMEKNVGMDSKVNQSSNTNTINNDAINHSNYTKTTKQIKSDSRYPSYDPQGDKEVLIFFFDPEEGEEKYPFDRPLNVMFTAKYTPGTHGDKDYKGNINITIDDNYSFVIKGNGTNTFNYTPTTEGIHTIKAVVTDTSVNPFYGQGSVSFTYHRFNTQIINLNEKTSGYVDEDIVIDSKLQYDNPIMGFEDFEDNVNVKLNVNDEIINIPVKNGIISYNYMPKVMGTNRISLIFEGNEYFNATSKSWNYIVKAHESELIIDNSEDFEEDIYVGDNVIINLTLRDLETKKAIPDATINVRYASNNYGVKTNQNGMVSITNFTAIAGKHTINFRYAGNNTVKSSNNTLNIEVLKRTPVITLDEIKSVTLGSPTVIGGKLLNISGNDTLEVNLIIDAKNHSLTVSNQTNYSYTYESTVGQHHVSVYTSPSDKYLQSNIVNSTFITEKIKTSILLDDKTLSGIRDFKIVDSVEMIAQLSADNYDYASDIILFNITSEDVDDELFAYDVMRDENSYHLIFTQIPAGRYNITAYTKDNENYTYSANSTTITVEKMPVVINASVLDDDVAVFSNVTIKVSLEDEKGNKLNNYPFIIELDNQRFEVASDENAEYLLTYKVESVGTNNVTVTLPESYYYYEGSKNLTFTVRALNTEIDINSTNVTVGQNATITITLLDENSNKLSNQFVTVIINNQTDTTKTNGEGCAVIYYQSTSPGLNNITATYDSTTQYNTSNSTANFHVFKHQTNITLTTKPIKINESEEITGMATDENNKAISNLQLDLLVNGEIFSTKTDENGYYTYMYEPIIAGLHDVLIDLHDDEFYNDSTIEGTFNVSKYNTTLTVVHTPVSYSQTTAQTTISGTLTDELSNPVMSAHINLEIDGMTHDISTREDGSYQYDYKTDSEGIKSVTATFNGDNKYNPSTDVQTNFEVVFENQDNPEDNNHSSNGTGNDTPAGGNQSGGDTPSTNTTNPETNVNINATNDTIENSNISSDISNTNATETNSTINNTNTEGNVTNTTSNITNSTQDNINSTGNVTDTDINSNNTNINNSNITGNGSDVVVDGTDGSSVEGSNVTGNGSDVVVNGTDGSSVEGSNVTSNSNGTIENTTNGNITNSNITTNATNITVNVDNVTIEDSNITTNITNSSINQNNTHINNTTSSVNDTDVNDAVNDNKTVINDTQNIDSNSTDVNQTDVNQAINETTDDKNNTVVENNSDDVAVNDTVDNNDDTENVAIVENNTGNSTDNGDSAGVNSNSDDGQNVEDSQSNDDSQTRADASVLTGDTVSSFMVSSFADVVNHAVVDSVVSDSAEETVNKAYELSEISTFMNDLKEHLLILLFVLACIGIGYYYKMKN